MRSIERLSGPDIISWPECTRDAPGIDAPAGWLIGILPAGSDAWPVCGASIFMVSADGFDIALCKLSECEGVPVVAGLVGGSFLVAETAFFAAGRFVALAFVALAFVALAFVALAFVALAFDADRGFAVVLFFADAFEAFAFGIVAGFFFVVSLTPGILCPSC